MSSKVAFAEWYPHSPSVLKKFSLQFGSSISIRMKFVQKRHPFTFTLTLKLMKSSHHTMYTFHSFTSSNWASHIDPHEQPDFRESIIFFISGVLASSPVLRYTHRRHVKYLPSQFSETTNQHVGYVTSRKA